MTMAVEDMPRRRRSAPAELHVHQTAISSVSTSVDKAT